MAIDLTTRMTQTEYAAHRGVTKQAISKIRDRLVLDADGRVQVMATDALLKHVLHPVKGGAGGSKAAAEAQGHPSAVARGSGGAPILADAPEGLSYTDAAREEKLQRVRKLKLEIAEQGGRLVDREEVDRTVFGLAKAALDSLLGIADRIATQCAAETDPHRVHVLIDTEARRVADQIARAAQATAPLQQAAVA